MNILIKVVLGLSIAGILHTFLIETALGLRFLANGLLGAGVASLLSRKKGLNIQHWTILGFAFGILIVPVLLFWKRSNTKQGEGTSTTRQRLERR